MCGILSNVVLKLADVYNHVVVTDPTTRQPGIHLTQQTQSLISHFQTSHGPCHTNLHKLGRAKSPTCDCGPQQTMNPIVDACPLTKFEDGLQLLREAEQDTVEWLESLVTPALEK